MNISNYKFLVVDDHFLLRQMVGKALTEYGVNQIDWATDGQDALKKINEAYDRGNPYDIVCLDWGMPKINGLEVLKTCRQDHKFDDMAIVMLTAEAEEINIIHAVEEGATAYITKPLNTDTLTQKLEDLVRWLERKQAKTVAT